VTWSCDAVKSKLSKEQDAERREETTQLGGSLVSEPTCDIRVAGSLVDARFRTVCVSKIETTLRCSSSKLEFRG
jgi:hypothetical protein